MGITWNGTKGIGCYATRNVRFVSEQLPGVALRHCMHPTANYPWFTHSKEGELRTFRTLAEAKQYAEEQYAN
jgi:hypothetical protein